VAGISPSTAGAMAEALALDIVTSRVRAELGRERAAGHPLKAAYHAVARRLGVSPRRIRAYHHHEVAAEEVTAAELLAADAAWRAEIETTKARIAALQGYHDAEAAVPAGHLAPAGLDGTREGGGGAGGSLARAAAALAGVIGA
jgi:hypothetical protein